MAGLGFKNAGSSHSCPTFQERVFLATLIERNNRLLVARSRVNLMRRGMETALIPMRTDGCTKGGRSEKSPGTNAALEFISRIFGLPEFEALLGIEHRSAERQKVRPFSSLPESANGVLNRLRPEADVGTGDSDGRNGSCGSG